MALTITKEIHQYLLTSANSGTKLETIARRLGVSKGYASKIMKRYPAYQENRITANKWSVAEIDYLIDHYATTSWQVLLKNLPGRSKSALVKKAREIGCPRRQFDSHDPVRIREEKRRPAVQKTVTERNCLCCNSPFRSEGVHNRLCNGCRASADGLVEYSLAM